MISESPLLELLLRFALTLGFNIIQMRIIGKHSEDSKKTVYSFFIISIVVFFLSHTLSTFDMQIGMAIGMFAVFGIVRYRTEPLRPQEMTYLFSAIGIAVINALSADSMGWLQLCLINLTILVFVYVLERFLITAQPVSSTIKKLAVVLDVSDLSKSTIEEKISKMEDSLGVVVVRHQLSKIDYAAGTAQLTVFYEV
ncbi:MAG TPA: hypothetical protein DHU80_04530 [Cryomorphaceae bacterium]|mgnify:FL=1|nr:hypothetical protein [Cryomorphaceae bacterium]HBB80323.1 hypothetical protein [Cryomorphaceae bacterium]HCY25479.1 hypothetical protein [Cryomorphaceae bacterium]